jgi:hypothetical protein
MGLGSGIRKKPISDPRVKKSRDPGSATLEKNSRIQGSKSHRADPGSGTLENMEKIQEKNTSVPEDGLVDVLGPVGGPHDKDGALVVRGEAVPQLHELCLDHGRRLVVVLVTNPQQAV